MFASEAIGLFTYLSREKLLPLSIENQKDATAIKKEDSGGIHLYKITIELQKSNIHADGNVEQWRNRYYEFHKHLYMMFVEFLITNKLIIVLIDSIIMENNGTF